MSAYIPSLSNLVSSTTSRYTSLRRTLLSSSNEDDSHVDDPDASHVSRVLRAYYTEKGRPLPAWLGVDPKDREKAQAPAQEKGGYLGSLRARGGKGGSSGNFAGTGSRGSGGGGLGDIWGESPPQSAVSNESLRPSLGPGRIAARRAGEGLAPSNGPGGARPLPSQRAGSYQSNVQSGGGIGRTGSPVPPGSSGSGSAQERLRARLAGRMGSSGSASSDDGGGGYDRSGGGRRF